MPALFSSPEKSSFRNGDLVKTAKSNGLSHFAQAYLKQFILVPLFAYEGWKWARSSISIMSLLLFTKLLDSQTLLLDCCWLAPWKVVLKIEMPPSSVTADMRPLESDPSSSPYLLCGFHWVGGHWLKWMMGVVNLPLCLFSYAILFTLAVSKSIISNDPSNVPTSSLENASWPFPFLLSDGTLQMQAALCKDVKCTSESEDISSCATRTIFGACAAYILCEFKLFDWCSFRIESWSPSLWRASLFPPLFVSSFFACSKM